MIDDKDARFVSSYIAKGLEAKMGIYSLLHLLSKRVPLSCVNYWVLSSSDISSGFSCHNYCFKKSSGNNFQLDLSKEQCWNPVTSDTHKETSLERLLKVIRNDAPCYELFEHSECIQAVKTDASDSLTGSRAVYSIELSTENRKFERSEKLVLKCVFPVLFYSVRQIGNNADIQVSLSKREIDVLEWIKLGKSTWDISLLLSITERTVNFHVKNIFKKLGVVSRAQAVAVAINFGLI